MKAMEMPIRQLSYYCNNTKCGDCEIKDMICCEGREKLQGEGGCDIPAYWEVKTDE